MNENYENLHAAFKAFDVRNKGTVAKSDFTVGLENL
jgi:hypothetical protein